MVLALAFIPAMRNSAASRLVTRHEAHHVVAGQRHLSAPTKPRRLGTSRARPTATPRDADYPEAHARWPRASGRYYLRGTPAYPPIAHTRTRGDTHKGTCLFTSSIKGNKHKQQRTRTRDMAYERGERRMDEGGMPRAVQEQCSSSLTPHHTTWRTRNSAG